MTDILPQAYSEIQYGKIPDSLLHNKSDQDFS